jgi:repressor LexA
VPTPRQRQVLAAVDALALERGYPPTLRELGAALGIRSLNGVNDHLRALERKGLLTRARMHSRTLVLTAAGRTALAEQEVSS